MKKQIITMAIILTSITHGAIAQDSNKIEPFSIGDVSINGGQFKTNEKLDCQVIDHIDPDRLLYTFRQNAGLYQPNGVKPYGGWEEPNCDLRGHTMGHLLTALSYQYAITQDNAIKQKTDYIISELARCQNAMGGGFLAAFKESLLDYTEKTGQGWAPYYTLHKILQGAIDVYTTTGNTQALQVAKNLGDYIYSRTQKITDPKHWNFVMDEMEQGGFSEAVLNLYKITGKQEHMQCAMFFQQMDKIEPAYENRDILNSAPTGNFHHANGTIPQFTAAERVYELTGDKKYLTAAQNFWEMVTKHRAYSNGSTGYNEYWTKGPDTLAPEMSMKTGETCCTYNLIKLSNDLFRLSPNSKYADYVERGLFNHILGSINPENGNFMYFHTQQPGSFKTFGRNEEVFWCCTGSGMENHLRYGESIYFKSNNALYVNQFIPSTLNWKEKEITLEQITQFPDQNYSTLKITKGEGSFDIYIRIPSWCNKSFSVAVNGNKAKGSKEENGYFKISNNWHEGDIIKITTPMSLWLQPIPDDKNLVSIMYGPIVLAGNLGTQGVTDTLINATDYFFGDIPTEYNVPITIPALTGNRKNLNWIKRCNETTKELRFITTQTSTGEKIILEPLGRIHNTRFTAYWRLTK